MQINEPKLGTPPYVGMPPELKFTDREWFQALDQFARVFAIRPGEKVLMLTDPLLDRRVVDAVSGIARARRAAHPIHGAQYPPPGRARRGEADHREGGFHRLDLVLLDRGSLQRGHAQA